jgi:outer membrane autotransporter protein
MVTAQSHSHINFYNGRVATGYNFVHQKTTLTPIMGVAYVHSFSSPYTESGAGDFDLFVDRNVEDNLEAQVGLEAMYATHLGSQRMALRANVGLGYELLDRIVTLQTAFAAFPTLPLFGVSSQSIGRLRTVLGAGVDVVVAKNARVSLDYIGDFKRHQYNNLGTVTLKVIF